VYLNKSFNTTVKVSAAVVTLRVVVGNTEPLDVYITRYFRKIPFRKVVLLVSHETLIDVELRVSAVMFCGGFGTKKGMK